MYDKENLRESTGLIRMQVKDLLNNLIEGGAWLHEDRVVEFRLGDSLAQSPTNDPGLRIQVRWPGTLCIGINRPWAFYHKLSGLGLKRPDLLWRAGRKNPPTAQPITEDTVAPEVTSVSGVTALYKAYCKLSALEVVNTRGTREEDRHAAWLAYAAAFNALQQADRRIFRGTSLTVGIKEDIQYDLITLKEGYRSWWRIERSWTRSWWRRCR